MGVQNLLYNLPFPPHPHSSQIKCKIHIQSSLFYFVVVIFFLFEHKIIETTYPPPAPTHRFAPLKAKCKIHIQGAPSFLLLSFYIVGNKNLNTKLVFKAYLFAILQYDYLAICINFSQSIT